MGEADPRAVERELQRIQREHAVTLEVVPVGIMMLAGRTIVWVNRAMLELFQYTRAEMVGHTTRMLYASQEDYERYGAQRSAVLGHAETFETESATVRKDGAPLWICVRGRLVDPDDESRGSIWVVHDRTLERAAREALRDSEAHFRGLFESHSAILLLVDPRRGDIVDANPAAEAFYGFDRATLRTMRVRDINALPPAESARLVREAGRTATCTVVAPHRRADGTQRMVQVRASSVDVSGRRLVFAIIDDITEREEMQRALAAQGEELAGLNRSLEARIAAAVDELRAKDQLLITQHRRASVGEAVGYIAHQWRQPLNALGLVLSNLRDEARRGDLDVDAVEQAVSHGMHLIQKMSSTISDFRDYARPSSERRPFSALAQVREALGLLDASLRHAGVAVTVEGDDARLDGFANEYSQVLLNLLSNAREAIAATRADGGRVTLRLSVEGALGRLDVGDDGGGVPASLMPRLFEPYASTRVGGTGIGLYMCRRIIEQRFGGRVEARNVDGGAVFSVLVPLARP